MSKTILSLAVFWSLLGPAAALGAEAAPTTRSRNMVGELPRRVSRRAAAIKPAAPLDETNLKVDVAAKYLDLRGAARFTMGNGTQANFITGGDKAHLVRNSQGEGVEFKKVGFIVNVLPILDPNDDKRVSVQLQVELSGPTPGIKVSDNEVPDISTWQWQSSFSLVRGKKTVVVESPAYLEISIELAD
ncbi:MAG: hypothetical protein ABIJ96_07870 [Elusimicrobiota bacterium]